MTEDTSTHQDEVAGEWGGVDVSFGEEGARLTYGSYLRLAQLLDQQQLESDPPAHDELLFITIHQVYELWFKQLLHELTAARDAMSAGGRSTRTGSGGRSTCCNRMHVIERVLVQQVDVLETMTPQDFLEFRQRLAPASGFQSVQFRELEFLSGAKDASFVERFRGLTDAERARLRAPARRADAVGRFLHVLGQPRPAHGRRRAGDRLGPPYRPRPVASTPTCWALAEALLQHDELAAAWRARHVVMVERMIGTKTGTGGSSGADYLRSRLELRYYPLLWELRSHL